MLEIWDLLDENGNKTGKIFERGTPFPEGYYHLGVDVWMVNAKNEILIQKRSPNKRNSPNVWAMTGGSNLKGETSLQTIGREVKEELGITLNVQDLQLMMRYKTGNVWLDEYFVRQEVDLKDIVMQPEEVCDVKWATYEEVQTFVEKGEFIEERWEYVRDFIRNKLEI